MKGFSYLPKVATLHLDSARCTGCGCCQQVCPHQVLSLHGSKARIEQRDSCMECGACAINCPFAAITVESGVGCASGMIREWFDDLRKRVGAEKNDSSCC